MTPKEYLIWSFRTKALWWTVIEFFPYLSGLFLRNRGKFCTFEKVLSDKSVYIFVEPPFPSSIRMGDVKLGLQAFGHAFILSEFFSAV